jgi:hypothetical protein
MLDLVFVGFLQLIDVLQAFPEQQLISIIFHVNFVMESILSRLSSQLLFIFLQDSVGMLGGEESNIVDLRPSSLGCSQIWSCARYNMAQHGYSEARHAGFR